MDNYGSLCHTKWECKYHIIWVPKYRRKVLYSRVRKRVGEITRELCRQRGIELLEGNAMIDHMHLVASIPPKYSLSNAVGFFKGKSAIRLHREFLKNKLTGKHFWISGYNVSTVGFTEDEVRRYVREQEKLDKEQMSFEVR